jgi:hypothetical protein
MALPAIWPATPKIEKIPAPIMAPMPIEMADHNPIGFLSLTAFPR